MGSLQVLWPPPDSGKKWVLEVNERMDAWVNVTVLRQIGAGKCTRLLGDRTAGAVRHTAPSDRSSMAHLLVRRSVPL